MAVYSPFHWANFEWGQTPISEANLNHIEEGIYEASKDAATVLANLMQGGVTVAAAAPANKPNGHLWVNSNDAELYTLHINNGQAGDVYVPVMMTPVPRVDYLAVQAVPPNSGVKDMPPEISHGTFTYPTKLVGLCSWSYGAADVAHNCDLDVTDTAGNSINVGPRTAGSAAITVDVPPGIHYAEWTMHVAKTFPANTEVRFKCRYNNGGGVAYLRAGITSWVYPDKG